MNLSVCMIVKNEELILERSLESIKPIADATVLFNLPDAEKCYLEYISNPLKRETSVYLFDFERHFIHPNLVLGQIYFQTNRMSKSQKYLNIVYRNSKMNKTKQSAMLLLDKIQYLQR